MEITDFRIVDTFDPEESDSLDAVAVFAREQGLVLVKCRFSVGKEEAMALVPVPRSVIGDSEFDLDARCKGISQQWADGQPRARDLLERMNDERK